MTALGPAITKRRRTAEGGLDRQTLVIVAVVAIGLVMPALDTTIVNVALDKLAADLHAPLNTVQWVATAYLLSLAVVIPLSGWMEERFGSKRIWLISVGLFGAGSALCGLSSSIGELIGFRVLQGLGGGMLIPVGFTLVAQSAGPKKTGRVLSLVGVPILLGPIFGPIIGGLVVDNVTWRWIFFVNVPIAVVAFGLAGRILSDAAGRADAGRLDWRGAALLCSGLVGIVFGLSETEAQGGFTQAIAVVPILAGAALVAAFALRALRTQRPLIDVHLFRVPAFGAAAATTFLLGIGLFGAMILLPLYYQLDRGESALAAGLLMAPQGLGAAAALGISGRLTDAVGGGRVVLVGATLATLATIPWAFVGPGTSQGLLAALLFVRGVGMGASIQPAAAAALSVLTPAQVPRATAALNTIRQVGASIGTAVAAVLLESQARAAMPGAGGGSGILEPLSPAVRAHVAVPLADAFHHAFAWVIAASALAALGGLALTVAERRARPAVA
ncbi:MAG TPA: MDR family MFS transporter [Solirubrobacteraceae bacterium]|jgi:EmrB/QacA subfamily drug resistance transporter